MASGRRHWMGAASRCRPSTAAAAGSARRCELKPAAPHGKAGSLAPEPCLSSAWRTQQRGLTLPFAAGPRRCLPHFPLPFRVRRRHVCVCPIGRSGGTRGAPRARPSPVSRRPKPIPLLLAGKSSSQGNPPRGEGRQRFSLLFLLSLTIWVSAVGFPPLRREILPRESSRQRVSLLFPAR